VEPLITTDTVFGTSADVWCLKSPLEDSMQERFAHGLLLSVAAILGSLALFGIALVTNNIGPSSKRYPLYWWG
jgi:hypothetical protein